MTSLAARVQALEAAFGRIQATRMAGLPLLHPGLRVQAVGFAADGDGLAQGVLVTPWFMNLVRLPLDGDDDDAAGALPEPGQALDLPVGGWRMRFLGQHEPGLGRFAAASLVSPMSEFADQAAALATARAVLETLRPRPARRGFLFGAARAGG
ncbi:MAG: [NiFe]-hydrogenase assembly chaperone HybE [Proteobacteria bacterium]|nr:[NiFe]-hydrogenase assembly chaperone HybE [Pseudomonadota bacterium]